MIVAQEQFRIMVDESGNGSDAARFRALAHPLRLRILEVVRASGAVTATEVGRVVGESPANCSFHLRVLAEGGFIEAVPGADRRQHPWRASSTQVTIDPLVGSSAQRAAARDAVQILREGDRRLLSAWDNARADAPARWQQAGFERSAQVRLTAGQLARLGELWEAALEQASDSPPGAGDPETVQLQMVGFPTRTDW